MNHCKEKVCDFCKHYDFNGIILDDGSKVYTGLGYCHISKKPSDPDNECKNFECKICE